MAEPGTRQPWWPCWPWPTLTPEACHTQLTRLCLLHVVFVENADPLSPVGQAILGGTGRSMVPPHCSPALGTANASPISRLPGDGQGLKTQTGYWPPPGEEVKCPTP
jgi:hypothetical protein